jgi:glycosyltransferase involved in cell wall biosynthesis
MAGAARIGVNALYLIPGGVGGTETYLRNLLKAFATIDQESEYVVFTNKETGADLVPKQPNFQHAPQNVRGTNRPMRLLWEQFCIPRASRKHRLDALFNPGFTAPACGSCPNITVFHDVQHKKHPEHFRTLDLPGWNLFLRLSVRNSRVLLADSQATKQDILRFYKVVSERIVVAPLGVEEAFFAIANERCRVERMLLCVSTLHPHKNLERLIRVFAEFHSRHPEYRLVIAGMRGFRTQAIEVLIKKLNLQHAIQLTGWIPREDLYELFRRAEAFFYPSTFEGFGLPVIEAMAAGVPLACSSIEPLRSIVGDSALTFAPEDSSAMLDAMEKLTADPELRSRLAGRATARARSYTWENCASITLAAIRDVISEGPRAEP